MTYDEIQNQLRSLSNAEDGLFLQRFFKTAPGQYGAGDLFRGIRVPILRRLSRACQGLPIAQTEELLHSAYHEDRLLALFLLILRFEKTDEAGRTAIYGLYLNNTRFINNWDLVDASAAHIVGAYLSDRDLTPLFYWARSHKLWERRMAIVATFHFIKGNRFDPTLRIAGMLLSDTEDLIHKAVGWMLREVGKRDLVKEEDFLRVHCGQMPRTMLRYAIERFPEEKRQGYLRGVASIEAPS